MTVKRGQIWLVVLDPTLGREIQKTRPCVVISPPEMNDHLQTAIVAPMTTGSKPAGFRIPVHFQGQSGLVLLDQIRAVDKQRLVRLLGPVPAATMADVLSTLQAAFEP